MGPSGGPVFGPLRRISVREAFKKWSLFLDPKLDPKTNFFPFFFRFFCAFQVHVFWTWNNYLESQCPSGRRVLHINLDETGLELFNGDVHGNIFFKRSYRHLVPEPQQRANTEAQKTALTHVAMVCNEPSVQPLLPQVLLGPEHVFQVQHMQEYLAAAPRNVYLLRVKSRWTNEEKMVKIIKLLSLCLGTVKHLYHIILSMDTAPSHLNAAIGEACARYDIYLLYIPSRLTWLVQPLDCYVFRAYKRFVREQYQMRRSSAANGVLTIADLLLIIYDTIRIIMCGKPWGLCFLRVGCGQQQSEVSHFIRRQLQVDTIHALPATQPTSEQLRCIWPRNKTPVYRSVFRLCLRSQAALESVPAPLLALPAPAVVSDRVQRLAPQRPSSPPAQGASSSSTAPVPPPPFPSDPPAAATPAWTCPVTRAQSRLAAALTGPAPTTASATSSQQSRKRARKT